MSVRAGSAIPTGAAERSLGSLYQQREEAWPFLAAHLAAAAAAGDGREGNASRSGVQPASGTDAGKGEAGVAGAGPVASEVEGADKQEEGSAGTRGGERSPERNREGREREPVAADGGAPGSEAFSLTHLSGALGAFARACEDRGCALEDFAVQDLVNFFYLGGQTKASCSLSGVDILERSMDPLKPLRA